jgi:hypothetical protein
MERYSSSCGGVYTQDARGRSHMNERARSNTLGSLYLFAAIGSLNLLPTLAARWLYPASLLLPGRSGLWVAGLLGVAAVMLSFIMFRHAWRMWTELASRTLLGKWELFSASVSGGAAAAVAQLTRALDAGLAPNVIRATLVGWVMGGLFGAMFVALTFWSRRGSATGREQAG